ADAESVTLLLRLRGNSEVELRALSRRRELTRSVIPLIAKAQESGEIRSDISPAVLTRMCFGLVNSLADWYEPDGELGPEQIAQDVVALLFGGLDSRR
ncbi:MAG: TetR/AcrR family transcriptional regulator, partial [Corynebacterium flavescens]